MSRDFALWSKDSVDGKDLYYVNDRGLWKIAVSGGKAINVAQSDTFVPAVDGIYYVDAYQSQPQLLSLSFLDFKTQQRRPVGVLPGPQGWNIEISPDSHRILYSKFDRQGSELMLVDNLR